jgi:hypothetical protein
MSSAQLYDTIGAAYTVTRRTEPRIAARIWAALGDARPHDTARVTQWEQAIAVATRLNQRIHHAVIEAQDWAKTQWPGTTRYQDLAWTRPDEAAWAQHQPHSPLGSWILRNDTWIHPSKAGAAQLAHTVTSAMCADFRHWCGATPHWG